MKASFTFKLRYFIIGFIFVFFFFPVLFIPRKWHYRFFFPVFNFLYLLAAKVKVTNLSTVDINQHAPVIYAANHKSYIDSIMMGKFLKKPYTIFINYEMTQNIFFKIIAMKMGLIPVDRDEMNFRSHLEAIQKCLHMIARKQYSVIFFPEGRHYYDRIVGPLKRGIVKLARDTKVPVVPVAVYGIRNDFVFEKKMTWKQGYVKAGEKLYFEDFTNEEEFLNTLKSKIELLYQAIEKEISQN